MARPKGSFKAFPEYRLHRASGQAIVTLSGETHYLGNHGTKASRAEYDRLLAEWIAAGRQPLRASDRTVAEVVAAFWTHAKTYYKSADGEQGGELQNYRDTLRPLKRLYGEHVATDFGPLALKTLLGEMIKPQKVKDPKTGKVTTRAGWSRNYANRQLSRLKSVFKWAVGAELIPATVYHALMAVPGLRRGKSEARENEPVKPVPEAYVEAAKQHLPEQIRDMIDLQALTGMRPGEVTRMRGCDVEASGDVWTYRPPRHKKSHLGHDRTIDLGPKAQAIVSKRLKPDLQAYLFSPADVDAERRAVLSEQRKTPLSCGNRPGSNVKRRPGRKPGAFYSVNTYRNAIARACDKADAAARKERQEAGRPVKAGEVLIPRWHPNQIRHNAATAIRKAYGIEAARVVLGHESEDMTATYAERDRQVSRDVMLKIG